MENRSWQKKQKKNRKQTNKQTNKETKQSQSLIMKVTKRKNVINSITQTSGPFPSALREQWNRHDTLKNHFCLVSFYVLHCTC